MLLVADVLVPLELAVALDSEELEDAIHEDDHTVELPGPYDTGMEDHTPPGKVCVLAEYCAGGLYSAGELYAAIDLLEADNDGLEVGT